MYNVKTGTDMRVFFHASSEVYKVGERIPVDGFHGETTWDYAQRTLEEQCVYDLLDSCRPDGCYSRKRCIFLFSNQQQCESYASSQLRKLQSKGGRINVYRVHSDDEVFGGFPFCLVDKVYKTYPENCDRYISEYWSPTQGWKVKEYLAKSIIIDEIIDFPAKTSFGDDKIDKIIAFSANPSSCGDYADDKSTLESF